MSSRKWSRSRPVEVVDVTSKVLQELMVKLAEQTRDGAPIHQLVYLDGSGCRCIDVSHPPSGQMWTFRAAQEDS